MTTIMGLFRKVAAANTIPNVGSDRRPVSIDPSRLPVLSLYTFQCSHWRRPGSGCVVKYLAATRLCPVLVSSSRDGSPWSGFYRQGSACSPAEPRTWKYFIGTDACANKTPTTQHFNSLLRPRQLAWPHGSQTDTSCCQLTLHAKTNYY